MKHLSLFLCRKYLCARKVILLSIIAVALSCALLITVASLFTGFIDTFEKSSSRHMADIVVTAPDELNISRYDELIDDLQANPNIVAATGVLSSQGLLLLNKGNVRAVKVWGIELPRRTTVMPFAEGLIRQNQTSAAVTFSAPDEPDRLGGFVGIAVLENADDKTDSYDMEKVKAHIGKKVLLTTGSRQNKKSIGIKFNITDVVFSGIYEFDKNFIYLPIEELAEELYPGEGKLADIIHIRLKPGIDSYAAISVVRGIFRKFATEKLDWSSYAISMTGINTSVGMQAQLISEYKKQMAMLMLIFGVVSGGVVLLICCIFYLIVMTRQKDIAVVKSCGLGSGSVALLFVTFGMITGLIGSALGIAVGCAVIKNVNRIEQTISSLFGLKLWKSSTYMFSTIPNQIDWNSVVWIVAVAVLAAGIGALIPAVVAARLKPVEILRYE